MEWFLPAVLALVIGAIIGVGSGIFVYASNSKSRIRQSETEARLQLESARTEQKDLILNAKDEALRLRNEAEAQIRDLRGTSVLFKTDGDKVKKFFLPNG